MNFFMTLFFFFLANTHLLFAGDEFYPNSCERILKGQLERIHVQIRRIDSGKENFDNLAETLKFYAEVEAIDLQKKHFPKDGDIFHSNKNFAILSQYIYLSYVQELANHYKEALKKNTILQKNLKSFLTHLSTEKYKLKKKLLKLSSRFKNEFNFKLGLKKNADVLGLKKKWQKDSTSFGELFLIFGDTLIAKFLRPSLDWQTPLPHLAINLLNEIYISLSSLDHYRISPLSLDSALNFPFENALGPHEKAARAWLKEQAYQDSEILFSHLKSKSYPRALLKLKIAYLHFMDAQIQSISENHSLFESSDTITTLISEIEQNLFHKKTPLDEFRDFINPPLAFHDHLREAMRTFSASAVNYYLSHLKFTLKVLSFLDAQDTLEIAPMKLLKLKNAFMSLFRRQKDLIEALYKYEKNHNHPENIESLEDLRAREDAFKAKLFSEFSNTYPDSLLTISMDIFLESKK